MPFSSDELVRALSEVSSWGLDHSHGEPFTILSMPELPQPSQQQPSNESRAVVHLLDDGGAQQAIVGVSEQGWRVCMRSVPVDRVSPVRMHERKIHTSIPCMTSGSGRMCSLKWPSSHIHIVPLIASSLGHSLYHQKPPPKTTRRSRRSTTCSCTCLQNSAKDDKSNSLANWLSCHESGKHWRSLDLSSSG